MQKRILFGNTQREVAHLGLGCMSMSGAYGTSNDATSIKTIHRALDMGYNFLDTADIYGMGHNEELVGKAIQGRRDEVFLASKFGLSSFTEVCGKPDYVRTACEKSLKRLNVETIDLYYLHRLDPATPVEETVGAMSKLVEEGKVRFLGLSEISAATLKKANKVHPISAVQSEYSLWWRKPEKELLPLCKEMGIAFVPYSPLGRGMFTGKINALEKFPEGDIRGLLARFQGEALSHNYSLVESIRELAQSLNVTPGQLALSWLLHQGQMIFPIPGTKTIQYLEENWHSLDFNLDAHTLSKITQILDRFSPQGERYPEAIELLVDRS